jgi:predicted NAD/FAD-binding protein
LKDALEFLAGLMPPASRSRRYEGAIVAFASMAGALILARAVSDENLSNRILGSTARRVIHFANSASPSILPRRTPARTRSSQPAK